MTTKNLFLALTGVLMILAAVSNTRGTATETLLGNVVVSEATPTSASFPGIADVTTAGDGVDVRLAADQSRLLVSDTNGTLLVEVIGRDDATIERTPVAIALVIDTSGSMAGDKIEQARVAAARLVSQLENGDVLTVVTYGRSAATIVRAEELGEDRSDILGVIRAITTAGNTCMSCGMEVAYDLLSDAPAGHVRRAVVLSDGQANQGISSADGLSNLAAHAGDAGTVTATIGLGSDYNEVLMAGVASAGTGAYYFMPDGTAMASILERELNALSNTVARDLYLTVRSDGPARIEASDILGATATKDGIRIH
ncbi:MAG: Ca-activated chloride channel family protein, partial [Bradymonadia bacterium]